MSTGVQATVEPDRPTQSLRSRVIQATAWIFAGSFASSGLRLLSNLILTRLLAPEYFGVMSLATTLYVVISLLADAGLRPNVIQSPRGDEPAFLNAIFTVQILRGFLVFLLMLILGGVLIAAVNFNLLPKESAYADPSTPYLVAIIGSTSIVSGFRTTKVYLADRRLELGRVSIVNIGSQALSLVATIVLAYFYPSVWALVAGNVISCVLNTICGHLYLSGPKDRISKDRAEIISVLKFGQWVLYSTVLSVFSNHGGIFVIAALISSQDLGLFSLAAALVTILWAVITQIYEKVFFPALSEKFKEGDEVFRKAYIKIKSRMAPIIYAPIGLLFFLSEPVVEILYDGRYIGAATFLQALSLRLLALRYSSVVPAAIIFNNISKTVWPQFVTATSTMVLVVIGYYLGGAIGAAFGISLARLASAPLLLKMEWRYGLFDFRAEVFAFIYLIYGLLLGASLLFFYERWFSEIFA